MNEYCTFDYEELQERSPEQTSGKPDYVCRKCRRVYMMHYPLYASGSAYLEMIYAPINSGNTSAGDTGNITGGGR